MEAIRGDEDHSPADSVVGGLRQQRVSRHEYLSGIGRSIPGQQSKQAILALSLKGGNAENFPRV